MTYGTIPVQNTGPIYNTAATQPLQTNAQSISNNTLSNRQITTQGLSKEYLDPAANLKSFKCKKTLWTVAAYATSIAFTVIATLAAFVLISNLSFIYALPLMAIGTILVGNVIIAPVFSNMITKATICKLQEHLEKGVVQKLQQIRDYTPQQIQNLAFQNGVDLTRIPFQNYGKNNQFKALLAYYLYCHDLYTTHYNEARNLFNNTKRETGLWKKEIKRGWAKLEREALPNKFKTVYFLERIYNPNLEQRWIDIGKITPDSYGGRHIRAQEPHRNTYFEFNDNRFISFPDARRASVQQIHALMFPRA